MKNILTIIRKEFARFFKDRIMIITILIPGLMIFLIYTVMGTVITDKASSDKNEKFSAYVINMPLNENLNAGFDALLEIKEYSDVDAAKADVTEGVLDLVIIFPENFDVVLSGQASLVPDVGIFYNSSKTQSQSGYFAVSGLLEGFKNPSFSVNAGGNADLIKERDFVGGLLSNIMPMLMFALLASGCVAVAPESIAGEKERGTMATLLITPIKRWQLALGKIISLTCFALLSGFSSFLGVILSLPKLLGGAINGQTALYYSVGDYFMLLALIISVVLVIISVFSVLSTLSKSVKEAGSTIAPVMFLIILCGMFPMFLTNPAVGLYSIPLMGSGLAMSAIMTFSITPLAFVLSVISNLVVAGLFITLLSFMFKSEKIMFNK